MFSQSGVEQFHFNSTLPFQNTFIKLEGDIPQIQSMNFSLGQLSLRRMLRTMNLDKRIVSSTY